MTVLTVAGTCCEKNMFHHTSQYSGHKLQNIYREGFVLARKLRNKPLDTLLQFVF